MPRIVFIQGRSQYQSVHAFLDALESGMESNGWKVDRLNLDGKNPDEQLKTIFSDPCQALMGFNGLARINLSKGLLGEILAVPQFDWLVDHPLYHMDRLKLPTTQATIACVDQDHVHFVDQTEAAGSPLFLPHGGEVSREKGDEDRPIDLLFTGTGVDPETVKARWTDVDELTLSFVNEAIEAALGSNPIAVHDLLESLIVAKQLSIGFDHQLVLMREIETYLRAHQRLEILKELDQSNRPVDIFGDGWKFAEFQNHRVHPAVNYQQNLRLMASSKIVINASLMFPSGAHERVFSSMANGAVCLTNHTPYLEENFQANESILFYNWLDRSQISETITALLCEPIKLKSIAENGRDGTLKNHLWTQRARVIHEVLGACTN